MAEINGSTPNIPSKLINNTADLLVDIDFEPLNFDIEQLDDDEFQIPAVADVPTLESILNEPDDTFSLSEDLDAHTQGHFLDPNSETQSLSSQRSRSGEHKRINLLGSSEGGSETRSVTSQRSSRGERKRSSTGILRHVLLKGISGQLSSASDRADAGTATCAALGGLLAVGMSRGLVLVFDFRQVLRWALRSPDKEHGSVSCLCFNSDSSRLLAGYARGLIIMYDLTNGNVIRTITDAHPPNTAVLSIKFTDLPNLALCADSGGSVFELSFTRTLGVRGCETRCLFSGSRGEVTTVTPLLMGGLRHPLEAFVVTAMATLTKVIIVSVRPKLRVVLVRPLMGGAGALPLLAWQLVPIQTKSFKVVDPVLACAKGDTIFFYQVSVDANSKISVATIQKIVVGYSLLACHWMNQWTLALLDGFERLHIVDVFNNEQLEGCDLSNIGLVYESSHFKGIFTGGNVSKAMARAGEKACYNTVACSDGQLLLLGGRSLNALTIRPWSDRLEFLVTQRKYALALSLALSFYDDPKTVTGVRGSKERKKEAARSHAVQILYKYIGDLTTPEDDIPTIVQYAVQFKSTNVLYTRLWEAVYLDQRLKTIFLSALEPYILNDQLSVIPPVILQQFVISYEQAGKFQALEACILHADICSLDLHLVMQTCKAHALYDAIIHLQNQAFADYVSPINEFVPILQNALSSGRDLSGKEIELGNKLLVYISCCLAGRGYPYGDVPKELVHSVKHDVYTCITCIHSQFGDDEEPSYPYLRTLLHFDTREFLNVVALAFMEPEFTSELGLTQRQRLVDILLQIMVDNPEFSASEVGTLFTFLARQISRTGSGLTIPPHRFHPVFLYLTDDSAAHREERQQTLLELLRAAGLQGFPKDHLLQRAHKSGFFRVCEVIYEQCGEWDEVFQCYLKDPLRQSQVFSFLRNMFVLSRSPEDLTKLLDSVQLHLPQLLVLDQPTTFQFVAKMMLDRLPDLLKALNEQQRLNLLHYTLFSSKEDIDESLHDLQGKYLATYVELTAKLSPALVVPILQEYLHMADLDAILDVTQACHHADGQAFVLESRGDYNGAFKVLNTKISELMESVTCNGDSEELLRLVKASVKVIQGAASNDLWKELLNTVLCKTSLPTPEKTKLLQLILSGSTGYSHPSAILDFLMRHPAYSGATYGELRHLFTGMLEDSRYEHTLATTTLRLVHTDLHKQLVTSIRSARRAVRPTAGDCCVCGDTFSRTSVVVFPCGHPVHQQCSTGCQCAVCGCVAVDMVPFRRSDSSEAAAIDAPATSLKLKLAARPVADLELLY